jgi:putative FmdB family regulatory protein
MPTYEYRCDVCQRTFEVQQRITDPPATSCAVCGARQVGNLVPVHRLISRSSFVLLGRGWGRDGYGGKR